MGYEKPEVPLWHFQVREPMTRNDLVKIRYDNGSFLYVSKVGEYWVVDSHLLSKDLLEIRKQHNTGEFVVVRCTDNGMQSGYVGSPLVLEARAGERHDSKRIRCTSLPVVMDISPSIRPWGTQQTKAAYTVSVFGMTS